MGMSLSAFHDKLDVLISPEYLEKAEQKRCFLDEWLSAGNPIVTVKKKGRMELQLAEGEYFVQCFAPDKPVRNELPIFWFYSNFHHLVSVWTNPNTGEQ